MKGIPKKTFNNVNFLDTYAFYCAEMFGELKSGKAELGWGSIFVKPGQQDIEYTHFYHMEPTCFLLKRPQPLSGVLLLLLPLELESWLFLLFALLVLPMFYYLYQWVSLEDNRPTLSNLILFEASVALRESHDLAHDRVSNSLRYKIFFAVIERQGLSLYFPQMMRFVNGVFMLSIVILSTAYSGALFSIFTVDVFPKTPHTVDEIAQKMEAEGMNILVFGKDVAESMGQVRSDTFLTLSKHVKRHSLYSFQL